MSHCSARHVNFSVCFESVAIKNPSFCLPSAPETQLHEVVGDFIPLLLFQSKTAWMTFVGSVLWTWNKVALSAGSWLLRKDSALVRADCGEGHRGISELLHGVVCVFRKCTPGLQAVGSCRRVCLDCCLLWELLSVWTGVCGCQH